MTDTGSQHSANDVALAVGLTFASGLATTVGAMMPFCIGKKQRDWILGVTLAFSGGVMLYISFAEILGKSLIAFRDMDNTESVAHLKTSGCFFGGIMFMAFLDYLVHYCIGDVPGHSHGVPQEEASQSPRAHPLGARSPRENGSAHTDNVKLEPSEATIKLEPKATVELQPIGDSNGAILNLDPAEDKTSTGTGSPIPRRSPIRVETSETAKDDKDADLASPSHPDSRSLLRSGIFTAIAVGLHNFPEGLATFISTLYDPQLGASIAVAIAIHNIPEGIAVAMPVYYASKSKTKAFMYAFGSGIAEPIGGLIGWGIMHQALGEDLFGVMFGIIAGMMVYISVKELLPTARKQDPNDRYVTWCVIAGFVVMDVSLVLFKVAADL